ncbi:MAG TPA: FAD-dependent oxidoreductase [Solirubrobacterales bacterium]|nr:FAD-dependent oxidoreductase [Solirubrobacterales bacterium]
MPDRDYDVVVVGGSLAGCAAARLLALRGARVAVVEKRPELNAYKVVCTHNIQAGAMPAIERLGIGPAIRKAGAVRAQSDISDYSSGRRFSPLEKLVYSTAGHDAELAGRVEDFGTRSIGGIACTRRMITRAAQLQLGFGG